MTRGRSGAAHRARYDSQPIRDATVPLKGGVSKSSGVPAAIVWLVVCDAHAHRTDRRRARHGCSPTPTWPRAGASFRSRHPSRCCYHQLSPGSTPRWTTSHQSDTKRTTTTRLTPRNHQLSTEAGQLQSSVDRTPPESSNPKICPVVESTTGCAYPALWAASCSNVRITNSAGFSGAKPTTMFRIPLAMSEGVVVLLSH